jgi:alpha-tubulin suppressor-like RCC1 family protein
MKNHVILSVPLAAVLLAQAAQAGAPAGRVVGWGFNFSGQATGVPTDNGIRAPNSSAGIVAISGQVVTDAASVACGGDHSLALGKDGTVVGWGANTMGCAVGFDTGNGSTSGIVRLGGRILSNVTAVAAGMGYSLALRDDGSVVGWGRGFMGERLSGLLPVSNAVAIAAGATFDCSLVVQRDGTLMSFWAGVAERSGLSNVSAIAVGTTRDLPPLALGRDGAVVLYSLEPARPELAPPPGLSKVKAIAAGRNHYLALKDDGTVFGWGGNLSGQATGTASEWAAGLAMVQGAVLSNVVAIAASDDLSVALKRDGTVVAWGRNDRGQTDVPVGLSGVVAISAGWHCLAVTTNANALILKR